MVEVDEPLEGEIVTISADSPRSGRSFRANTPDITVFLDIMVRMANGEALTRICKDESEPTYYMVMQWIMHNDDLKEEYMAARQIQADYYADSVVDIADNEIDNFKARVQIDSRRWHASKVAPKKYGNTINATVDQTITHKQSLDLSNMTEEAREQLKASLIKQLRDSGYSTDDD